jgi:probable HAF family extracellular repeat protein
MRTLVLRRSILAAALLAALAQGALGAPTYTITDLGDLGESYAIGYAVSDSGLVTGRGPTAGGYDHAFLWESGVIIDLGTCGVADGASYGTGVNSAGHVAGYFTSPYGQLESVIWHDGSWNAIPGLASSGGSAQDVNDSDVVVGSSTAPSGYLHAYLWDGVAHDIGTLGGLTAQATGINNSNQVTGVSQTASGANHAFLWDDGVMTDLGHLGGNVGHGDAINNLGDVAGYSTDSSSVYHATLWQAGAVINLGVTQPGGYSYATDLNDGGQVVGMAWYPSGDRPFLWEDGSWIDLNTLLPAGSPWTLVAAYGINNSGQIVGYGLIDGQARGFILTPDSTVPAPGALILGLLGLGGIGATKRARSIRR